MSGENLRQHLQSVYPEKEPGARRGSIVNSLTAGIALAVQPVSAQTITTGATGFEAGEVKIPAGDGRKRLLEWFKKDGAA